MGSIDTASSQNSIDDNKRINPKIGLLFVLLIVMLFYLVPLIALAAGQDPARYEQYLYLYTVIFYTIIVLGIIIFHHKGLDVFQDHYSLWTIVLACLLAASPGKTNAVYRIFLLLLGLRLSIYILLNRKTLKMPSSRSVFVGLIWSAGTIIIIALLLAFLDPVQSSVSSNLLAYILKLSIYQLTFVTVIEEACFRGLLFGILRMLGYQEDRALMIQGILFWGIHYMRINSDPVLFFAGIPILTISLSLIAQKYKMLYLSVLVHTLVNVLGPVLSILI